VKIICLLGRLTKLITHLLLLFLLIVSSGCEKKQEQTKQADSSAMKDTAKIQDTTARKTEVPQLIGTWNGKFDKRQTTLKITEQKGNSFKGDITINYRQVINQQVSGNFDPATKKFTMQDLLHSRFKGKYSGKVSDDMKSMAGTFTMTLDGSRYNFNLAKK
jgi:hypothetical protein